MSAFNTAFGYRFIIFLLYLLNTLKQPQSREERNF